MYGSRRNPKPERLWGIPQGRSFYIEFSSRLVVYFAWWHLDGPYITIGFGVPVLMPPYTSPLHFGEGEICFYVAVAGAGAE